MSSVSTQSGTHPNPWKAGFAESLPYNAPQYNSSNSAPRDPQMAAPHQRYPMTNQPPQHYQPAPRQRTAIACRYCRRRKIRCSGFETSADARCSNCIRFHQECVFTPVSSQAQAFVPVQAFTAAMRDGSQLGPEGQLQPVYGAYGQPLGHVNLSGHYGHPPPHDAAYRLPPPNPPQSPSANHPPGYYDGFDPRSLPHLSSVQTTQGGGYPPIVPRSGPPEYAYHAEAGYPPQAGSSQGYYPNNPSAGQRYYEQPGSAGYANSNGERSSASPNSASQSGYQYGLHPPPPAGGAAAPPTAAAAAAAAPQQPPSPQPQAGAATSPRSGMSLSNILDGGKPGGVSRSATDNDMLNALNRKV